MRLSPGIALISIISIQCNNKTETQEITNAPISLCGVTTSSEIIRQYRYYPADCPAS
jgi:hypothetical protein